MLRVASSIIYGFSIYDEGCFLHIIWAYYWLTDFESMDMLWYIHVPAHMPGYNAPEFSMSGAYTMKSDVYSFGVVMLELLTGRKPFNSSRPRAEHSLVRWAAPQLHDIDALSKMVDPALKGMYSAKSLSRFADIISLCVQPEPEFRPPMSEVVQALVRLMQRAASSRKRSETASGAKSLEPPDSTLQE